MPDFSEFNVNEATGKQRALLNDAVGRIFPRESNLEQFLDEYLDWRYWDLVDDGNNYRSRRWSLTKNLAARGWLSTLVKKIVESEDYRNSPHLNNLYDAWMLDPPGASAPNDRAPADAPPDNTPVEAGPTHLQHGLDIAEELQAPVLFVPHRVEDQPEPLEQMIPRRSQMSVESLAELSRSVCMLRSAVGMGGGTGFLVASDKVLTTAYIVKDLVSEGLLVEFSEAANGAPAQTLPMAEVLAIDPANALQRDTQVKFRSELDFALIRVDGKFDARREPFNLDRSRQRLSEGEELVLFHYPRLESLKLSRGQVSGGKAKPDRMHHTCQTFPGSGGAPVFDTKLRLIGLHEAGTQTHNIAVRADRIAAALEALKITL